MDGSTIPIARLALPEAAAERLRTLITEGALPAGARLNERELCEQLGLSRTPLREAFRMLAAEGLVVQLPNRGAQVVAMSQDDVRHAFDVMEALEGLSGELACARVSEPDLAELDTLQAEMERAYKRSDLPGYYRVNRAIHEKINAVAGNPVLTQTYKALNARLHALRFRSNVNRAKWNLAMNEHREMLSALAERNPARLRDVLIGHLRAKREVVLGEMHKQTT